MCDLDAKGAGTVAEPDLKEERKTPRGGVPLREEKSSLLAKLSRPEA
jgi:hypothetical protein